mmetsp:Transcript_32530/g.64543  ORF Transcript_32530/g.64543 Transcript_32530/m.64543 type:complete len:498 (-) Transcript_32530:224-1717(-)
MTSDNKENNISTLCTFPSPLRELRLLDEETVLYCMEGDKDVYELKVSELKESSQESPGKLFCKVPYLGIPLVVKGGRAGRLVVVVPTDLNENAEKIEEWVTAVDSLSQASIPAPVKGRWNTATVHKDSIYLRKNRDRQLTVVPPAQIFVPPSPYLDSVCWTISLTGSPMNTSPNLKFLGGGERHLTFFDEGRKCVVESASETEITLSGPIENLSFTAACVFYTYDRIQPSGQQERRLLTYAFGGTASGHLHIWFDEQMFSIELFKSENAADPSIKTIAVLPSMSLVFSQGRQLLIRHAASPSAPSPHIPIPLSTVSAMRRLVFEGSEGADIALVVKADGGDEGGGEGAGSRKVHGMKFMLSANCEFFRSAFSGPFKESTNSTFPIPDTTFEALRCVVLYLHTDMVELETSFVMEVAALARFLGLPRLQGQAEWYATKCISLTTCASLLLSVERLNFPELRKQCINFAGRNPKEAHKAPEFGNLSKETLLEIFQAQGE